MSVGLCVINIIENILLTNHVQEILFYYCKNIKTIIYHLNLVIKTTTNLNLQIPKYL